MGDDGDGDDDDDDQYSLGTGMVTESYLSCYHVEYWSHYHVHTHPYHGHDDDDDDDDYSRVDIVLVDAQTLGIPGSVSRIVSGMRAEQSFHPLWWLGNDQDHPVAVESPIHLFVEG